MPLGLSGIRNQDKVKDYKFGETDYQSGQGLQTGVKELQIAAGITKKTS